MQFFTRALAFAAAATPFLASAAPVSSRQAADEIIPGKYIVQLKPETDIASIAAHHNVVREIHARNLAKRDVAATEEEVGIEKEYGFGDFKGYAGAFDAATVEELKALPEVRNQLDIAGTALIDSLGPRSHRGLHHDYQCPCHPKQRTMGPWQHLITHPWCF